MNDLSLVKIALDSGCAYLPAGGNVEPLYIFSLHELTKFIKLYEERQNERCNQQSKTLHQPS
jgi:hypothetical protein